MRKRLLCPQLPKQYSPVNLSTSESHHAIRVLRLRNGQEIEAIDGKGNRAVTRLRIRGDVAQLEFVESEADAETSATDQRAERTPYPVILEMAVLKGDAMEWVIEKSVELGVKKLVPVITDFTVVQIKDKGPEFFQNRWQKIADQALKQCGRLIRMEIGLPVSVDDLLVQPSGHQNAVRLWCDEKSRKEAPYLASWLLKNRNEIQNEVRILIGPEGGWSQNERVALSQESKVSPIVQIDLGANTLRAETAALFSVSLVTANLEVVHFTN